MKDETKAAIKAAINPTGYIIDELQAEIDRLKQQLPEEMQDCTIRFLECEKGHGRLTANNWVQHDCPKCEIDRLNQRVAELDAELKPCRKYQKDGETVAECLERNRLDAGRAIRLYGEKLKDAERYRWLRDDANDVHFWIDEIPYLKGPEFDSAIDAAIKVDNETQAEYYVSSA